MSACKDCLGQLNGLQMEVAVLRSIRSPQLLVMVQGKIYPFGSMRSFRLISGPIRSSGNGLAGYRLDVPFGVDLPSGFVTLPIM